MPYGNRFVCDCRLSWIYQLRNETPNEQIRAALDDTSCVLDGAEPTAPLQPHQQKPDHRHQNGIYHHAQQQQQQPLGVAHRGRFFGSPVSTDGPGFIRDEAVVQHVSQNDKEDSDYDIDEDYSTGPEDLMSSQQLHAAAGSTLTNGAVRNLFDLDPEKLPCPEPVKQPAPTMDDLDGEIIGQEFDEMNGVQTLTGTAAGSGAATSAWTLPTVLGLAWTVATLAARPRHPTT
ncbi:hypothetical protein ONE63_006924 [Megalurothrips usitatus]|uniref:Connectin-like n=1 Tax=Megalurothrips usitatus TaxID=439358 RepID=A0AAV7XXY5_9NEOP|nr:hypothetical protein ONE63_006924 [Megalurothrips usitatus]